MSLPCAGQHFLIPGDPGAPTPPQPTRVDELRVAKRKLQGLNNSVFEELSIDVYDEVDRRETDAIWNAVEGSGGKNAVIIPFLPVNPGVATSSAIIQCFCFLNEITLPIQCLGTAYCITPELILTYAFLIPS